MRLRAGIVVGFGLGYWFGAKAGRQRYEQMRRVVQGLVSGSRRVRTETQRVKAGGQLVSQRLSTRRRP